MSVCEWVWKRQTETETEKQRDGAEKKKYDTQWQDKPGEKERQPQATEKKRAKKKKGAWINDRNIEMGLSGDQGWSRNWIVHTGVCP